MKLGQGAAQRTRNPTTHDLTEPGQQEALEILAVLSYVARLVDAAEVVEAQPAPLGAEPSPATVAAASACQSGTAWA